MTFKTRPSPTAALSAYVEAANGNAVDITFLAHHEQVVRMGELVLAANPLAEVAALVTQVTGAQAPVVARMATNVHRPRLPAGAQAQRRSWRRDGRPRRDDETARSQGDRR